MTQTESTYSVTIHERLFVDLDGTVRTLPFNFLWARDTPITGTARLGVFGEVCQRPK